MDNSTDEEFEAWWFENWRLFDGDSLAIKRGALAAWEACSKSYDKHFTRILRQYQDDLRKVTDGPERAALIAQVNNQAKTIRELQASNR